MPSQEGFSALADTVLLCLARAFGERPIKKSNINLLRGLLAPPDPHSPEALARLFPALYICETWQETSVSPHSSQIISYFTHLPFLKFVPEGGDLCGVPFEELKRFGLKALLHPKIQEVTNTLIGEAFSNASPLYDKHRVPNVQFVDWDREPYLFGFGGFNTVYINVTAFTDMIRLNKGRYLEGFEQIAVKLMVASIVIQEHTRMQCRKVCDDVRVVIPRQLKSKYLFVRPTLLDPGVLVEIFAYGCGLAPAWLEGPKRKPYDAFLEAFENGTPFPEGNVFLPNEFVPGMYRVLRRPIRR